MTVKKQRQHLDPSTLEHIELFEQFLEAVMARRQVRFTHTKTSLKLHVLKDAVRDDYDRDDRVQLIRRSIAVLRKGIGALTATKGSNYFEFWVESDVLRALPPHQWASEDGGLLHPADVERIDCEECGLAPITLTPLSS